MTRHDAEKLIGTRVEAWTSANGIYIGTLIEVIPCRPWRGKIHITSVGVAAVPYDITRGARQRKGFRPGDIIEVGGVNVKPCDTDGTSYLDALRRQRMQYERSQQIARELQKHEWEFTRSLQEIDARIAEEEAKETSCLN